MGAAATAGIAGLMALPTPRWNTPLPVPTVDRTEHHLAGGGGRVKENGIIVTKEASRAQR